MPRPDYANTDIFNHQPSHKDLPDLDFSLAGFETVLDHVRAHVPNAKPTFEAIPSDGLTVRVIR